MLSIGEIAALFSAIKGAVDLFDRIAGQVKSVLTKSPGEDPSKEHRWRYKIRTENSNLVVKQDSRIIQTVSADQLASVLTKPDLELIQAYEKNMNRNFARWKSIYARRDASQDPTVNIIVEEQLTDLIVKMRQELIGILNFLEKCGIRLDDHYMHIRHLISEADKSP
jgi:hypothetical protein